MLVYRISKKEYINDLSGFGAALYGGRWNPKGLPLVYAAGNIALAYVEFLVHNYHVLNKTQFSMACIEIPGKATVELIQVDKLPAQWNRQRDFLSITQDIGKQFIANRKAYVLKAPSAVVPGEYNYLLNPSHDFHQYTKIKNLVEPFEFDPRLMGNKKS